MEVDAGNPSTGWDLAGVADSRLGAQSTTLSSFPVQSTSSPPGLDGVHSIGSQNLVAELSALSHHDRLGAQSTTLSSFTVQSTLSPPGLDGVHSIGSQSFVAELSVSSPAAGSSEQQQEHSGARAGKHLETSRVSSPAGEEHSGAAGAQRSPAEHSIVQQEHSGASAVEHLEQPCEHRAAETPSAVPPDLAAVGLTDGCSLCELLTSSSIGGSARGTSTGLKPLRVTRCLLTLLRRMLLARLVALK